MQDTKRGEKSCPINEPDVAYGYGMGNTLPEARNAARRMALDTLGGKDTHHVQYRCTGSKGEQWAP